jgi:hypothetical protein
MTAQLVHVQNPLITELGLANFEAEPGTTVSAIIAREELRLRYSTVLYRGGELVKRCDWDVLPLQEGEIVTLVTLPQGGGGGGSNPLQILAVIALAVIAPVLGGLAADALGTAYGLSAATVSTLGYGITGAIFIGGQMLISPVLPPPRVLRRN